MVHMRRGLYIVGLDSEIKEVCWKATLQWAIVTLFLCIVPYVSQIITLSDLECDYINAPTCCSKLNKWVLTELVATVAITALLFLSLHPWLCLLTMPLSAWLLYKFFTKPSGDIGLFDPTEIHNRQKLKRYLTEAMIKLGYHLVFFFIFLYSMILALIAG